MNSSSFALILHKVQKTFISNCIWYLPVFTFKLWAPILYLHINGLYKELTGRLLCPSCFLMASYVTWCYLIWTFWMNRYYMFYFLFIKNHQNITIKFKSIKSYVHALRTQWNLIFQFCLQSVGWKKAGTYI